LQPKRGEVDEAVAGRVVEDPLISTEEEADETPLGEACHLQRKQQFINN
jgi:hypothetical protein